jgi:hypothetical protein
MRTEKRLEAEMATISADGHWVTIRGAHVFVGGAQQQNKGSSSSGGTHFASSQDASKAIKAEFKGHLLGVSVFTGSVGYGVTVEIKPDNWPSIKSRFMGWVKQSNYEVGSVNENDITSNGIESVSVQLKPKGMSEDSMRSVLERIKR